VLPNGTTIGRIAEAAVRAALVGGVLGAMLLAAAAHVSAAPLTNCVVTYSDEQGRFWVVRPDGGGRRQLPWPTSTGPLVAGIDWSPDGSRIAAIFTDPSDSSRLEIRDRSAKLLRRVVLPDGSWSPRWSPDGRRIAFSTGDLQDGGDIYVIDASGQGLRNLTRGHGVNRLGAWSPDGRRLLISRAPTANGSHALWFLNSDGSGTRRLRLKLADADPEVADLSRDGKTIAFAQGTGASGIFTVSVDGSSLRRRSRSGDWNPRWSADGKHIAFDRGDDPPTDVWVMNADGSRPRQLTNSGTSLWDIGKSQEGWRCTPVTSKR
jgi:Tol biopolymer transport system component